MPGPPEPLDRSARAASLGPLVILALLPASGGVPIASLAGPGRSAPGGVPSGTLFVRRHDRGSLQLNGASPIAVSVVWNDTDDGPAGGYDVSYSSSGA